MNAHREGPSVDLTRGRLTVSGNGRYLLHADGTPFFYLGDTAWELFVRLTLEEAEDYLEARRRQGFTVVQAVALSEFGRLETPNRNGDLPLTDGDPLRPNPAYFDHIERVILLAAEKGMYVGLLPTWGDKVDLWKWGAGPVIFDSSTALAYGRFIGERFKQHSNLIWILGGDRSPQGYEPVWRAMARGIRDQTASRHLMTYHPLGWHSSAEIFHLEDWLDFNMLQSSHARRDMNNYDMITKDYARNPAKPCLDAEPCYEGHAVDWRPDQGFFDEWDCRKAAYWALFAGTCGHTYGCHSVWKFHEEGREGPMPVPTDYPQMNWREAVDLPGARSMLHLRRLMESRPFWKLVPDQWMLEGDSGTGAEHMQLTRAEDGSFVLVYIPSGNTVQIDLSKLNAEAFQAWWFNPRSGAASFIGKIEGGGRPSFAPPGSGKGEDWVLVVDDASQSFSVPGQGMSE